ncbi:cilia- and flagella- associated protein 210 [Brachionichthys hirsutus]|uniref:cilia- and flagella- associated protein 210 n=1 Tax=Brachionichthys hirsutus TaxID=412623 RepID=UPI0036052623
MLHPPDLRQVTVLSMTEWRRVQEELKQVDKVKERMSEDVKQREALHLQSEEVVRQWPNTIASQRQKKLEAKRIRDEIEEEKRKQIDMEEAKYEQHRRREAVEKARTQLYHQSHRVRELHSALLLTEVLKEREAQIELKQRIKSASKDVDKGIMDMMKAREDEALRQDQQKALQMKLQRLAVAEDLKQQVVENELKRQQQEIENKKEGEEAQHIKELYRLEQRMEDERQAEQKRSLAQAHLQHLSQRNLMRAADTQKQQAEEAQRKRFLSAKQKGMKLTKGRETELFREVQTRRERFTNKLTITQQEQTVGEAQRIAKAVAEQDAKRALQQLEEAEKRAESMKSIATHRELMKQEKEQRDKREKQTSQERLQATKEADRIFTEKQQLKAQRIREDQRKLQDFNALQTAEKSARHQQQRAEEDEFEEENVKLIAAEESQFQHYSQRVIKGAAKAARNVLPLHKAARERLGGNFGAVSCRARPVYLVQDCTGAQMPKYISGLTQNIKTLNEALDIQEAKRRLGFTW